MDFDKAFEPARIEGRWYDHWIRLGVLTAHVDSPRPSFSMAIPPPNVTGRLHMGHALNNTLQDILARWRRMRGDDVLWLPGTDHAGIATQMVVDRQLAKEGTSREALGREAFVRRVWQWKDEYGGVIIDQLKRLGCSCDWTRERFTMDPGLSRGVREAFVRLHEAGLIYRDKFIVNWCPRCRTAISDLEVIPQETHGHLWTIRYPLADGQGGIDRFDARGRVVADLRAQGFLVSVQDHLHNVGRCQRCNTIVEPYLSTQWFVRVKPLADEAIRAVADGRVRFAPAHWVNSYNEWMGKIHDWCISRQLWWGHQIPAWHCGACSEIHVAREAPASCRHCGGRALRQDPDVLDTWFSSALWPFSTLGWPDDTPDLRRYYPTTILVTGFDVLFFWVCRMIMMGLRFMTVEPFHRVYITGLVRDAEGQKMSKTRGNVVDPLDLIDRYGADALRLTLAAMATPGSDLPLSEERMVGYRAFANKIWNAARFVLLNLGETGAIETPPPLPPLDQLRVEDRWILSRLARLAGTVEERLAESRFDDTANALYQFVWHEYCDWYLEMAKRHLLPGGPPDEAARARTVLLHVLDSVLRLLHPVMPFITEDLWQRIPHRGETIALSSYPERDETHIDEAAERDIALLMEIVVRVRNIRAELNVDPGRRVPLLYHARDREAQTIVAANAATIATLARLEGVSASADLSTAGPAARAVAPGVDLVVPLAGILDLEAEKRRLSREIEKLDKEREGHARKLQNAEFLGKARPEIVDKARRIHQELQEKIDRLSRTIESLRCNPASGRHPLSQNS